MIIKSKFILIIMIILLPNILLCMENDQSVMEENYSADNQSIRESYSTEEKDDNEPNNQNSKIWATDDIERDNKEVIGNVNRLMKFFSSKNPHFNNLLSEMIKQQVILRKSITTILNSSPLKDDYDKLTPENKDQISPFLHFVNKKKQHTETSNSKS